MNAPKSSVGRGTAPILESDPERSRNGTRFRIFPQPSFLKPFREPATIRVSSPAGTVGAGPCDRRMHVIEPVGKQAPYGVARGHYGTPYLTLPPWRGPVRRPAVPDAAGHFDHLEVGTPAFEAAHAYACVRWVLDVWERYLGHRVEWNFRADSRSLEISVLPIFDNAHAGYGFLELGVDVEGGAVRPFSLNFDVIAHETGHLIIYSLLGVPDPESTSPEHQGFHESAADLVAMLAAAHFDPVLDDLFAKTHGNLYVLNELNRFAELSEQKQIRLASNAVRMTAFRDGWSDEHDLSLPLTGALFDILVDIYHQLLIERGLIDRRLGRLAIEEGRFRDNERPIQAAFDSAYGRDPQAFRHALRTARDRLGAYLAQTWRRLAGRRVTYEAVHRLMRAVDREQGGATCRRAIDDSFRWRRIGEASIGPRRPKPDRLASHLRSARTVVPEDQEGLPRMPYRERWMIARAAEGRPMDRARK